jgi:hypothetical protein
VRLSKVGQYQNWLGKVRKAEGHTDRPTWDGLKARVASARQASDAYREARAWHQADRTTQAIRQALPALSNKGQTTGDRPTVGIPCGLPAWVYLPDGVTSALGRADAGVRALARPLDLDLDTLKAKAQKARQAARHYLVDLTNQVGHARAQARKDQAKARRAMTMHRKARAVAMP